VEAWSKPGEVKLNWVEACAIFRRFGIGGSSTSGIGPNEVVGRKVILVGQTGKKPGKRVVGPGQLYYG